MTALETKMAKYLELIKNVQDPSGFIGTEYCDSLLFSCLVGCVPGVIVDPQAAQDPVTKAWFRRPLNHPECLSCGGSDSTISRDMLLGLAWYCFVHQRSDICNEIIKYALLNFGVMGKGSLGATLISPELLALFAEVSYQTGGKNHRLLRMIPFLPSKTATGYQAHLQILHLMLLARLGKIHKQYGVICHNQFIRESLNPLFAYAAGFDKDARLTLEDDKLYPPDRLPWSTDRKDPWLPQRDYGVDWYGDKARPIRMHSGGDLLFVGSLLLDKF